MRYHMKVVGQAASMRGTVVSLNPQSGEFAVKFDAPLAGNDGVPVQTVTFTQDLPNGSIADTTWGLLWVVIP
jgi:hypothetical protein